MKGTHIGIIGAGNIGSSIFRGLSTSKFAQTLSITDHNDDKLQSLHTTSTKDLRTLVTVSDIIICAVKPHAFPELAREIGKQCKSKIVVSVMASISIQEIQTHLGCKKVVRAMPTINAMIGKSTTAVIQSDEISHMEGIIIKDILTSIGTVVTVKDEDDINIATAGLSSTPGIIGEFMYQLTLYIQRLRISEQQAILLVNEIFNNTAMYTSTNSIGGRELQRRVATPGGTTEKALSVLQKYSFSKGIQDALHAAEQRARELGATK